MSYVLVKIVAPKNLGYFGETYMRSVIIKVESANEGIVIDSFFHHEESTFPLKIGQIYPSQINLIYIKGFIKFP